jgi:type II secretory pathway component PulF
MASFSYTALTAAGERVTGTLAAASEQAVLSELESRRLVPVSVRAQRERKPILVRRVSLRALGGAYRQASDLLRAGVPLLRTLRLLGSSKANPRLAASFKELADAVAEGSDLADAMSRKPDTFTTIHVAMVRAGEKGGFLEQVLGRLSRLVDGQAELRAKIIGNMIYPTVLVVAFTIVLGLIFGLFIPMFRPVLDRMGEPGLLTKSVLITSQIVRSYGLVLLAILIAAAIGAIVLTRRPRVRLQLARLQLRLPVLGPLTRAIAVARFCRVLGTMLGNNVPLLAAIAIAKDAAGNPILADAIAQAGEAVRAGQRLADPLGESGLFSEDVVEMIRVGEQANNLDAVLITVADTLESRVDRMLAAAIKLIEPLMLFGVAMVVMWVAMALIVPMTRLGGMV